MIKIVRFKTITCTLYKIAFAFAEDILFISEIQISFLKNVSIVTYINLSAKTQIQIMYLSCTNHFVWKKNFDCLHF